MDLNDLIPDSDINWIIKNDFLFYRKIQNIPICYIGNDNFVYIFLDKKIYKKVIKLIQFLIDKNIKFYCTSPELSDPKGVLSEEFSDIVIRNYLYSYSQYEFYKSFYKINFDIIKNMIEWCEYNNCCYLIKPAYNFINKNVQRDTFDYYTGMKTFEYDEEIREEFRTLYRQIQINFIL